MYGVKRDETCNRVVTEFARLYGSNIGVYDEAAELLHDMRDGCVIPMRYEAPRKGAAEEMVESVRVREDGTVVRRIVSKRGSVAEEQLSLRDTARVIGSVTGFEEALAALDA